MNKFDVRFRTGRELVVEADYALAKEHYVEFKSRLKPGDLTLTTTAVFMNDVLSSVVLKRDDAVEAS